MLENKIYRYINVTLTVTVGLNEYPQISNYYINELNIDRKSDLIHQILCPNAWIIIGSFINSISPLFNTTCMWPIPCSTWFYTTMYSQCKASWIRFVSTQLTLYDLLHNNWRILTQKMYAFLFNDRGCMIQFHRAVNHWQYQTYTVYRI